MERGCGRCATRKGALGKPCKQGTIWFIAYFLVSNLRKDVLEKGDVAFDVIQSAASFAAAFALGIAVHGEGFQFEKSSEAFLSANGAVLAICFFSLLIFGERDTNKTDPLNSLRVVGGITALLGFQVAGNDPLGLDQLLALTGTLLVLSALLVRFGRIRINELPDASGQRRRAAA